MIVESSLVALILLVHTGLLGWEALVNSPTIDEVAHLPAGMSHWVFGRFSLYNVNPPLVRMVAAIPVVMGPAKMNWSWFPTFTTWLADRMEFAGGLEFISANGQDSFWYYTIARWSCIPFSWLGALTCWRWARLLYGTVSGLLAMLFWCLSPNILAHASLLTPDVGAAACGFYACFCFSAWLTKPSFIRASWCGVSLGIALLTKFTILALLPVWLGVWVLVAAGKRDSGLISGACCLQVAVMYIVSLNVLNAGYFYEGSFQPLKAYVFNSKALSGNEEQMVPGNRFSYSFLGALPIPVPSNYLQGIDTQKSDFERNKSAYLRGVHQNGGWVHYYLYCFLVKEPLGLWMLFFLRLCWLQKDDLASKQLIPLVLPLITLFILVSSQTGLNRGIRYALPCFPLFYVWLSGVCVHLTMRKANAIVCCAVFFVISTLSSFPHSLSYFNESVGGPLNGHAHLLDSNIDWGQDLLFLRRWSNHNQDAADLHVAYSAFAPCSVAGFQPIALSDMSDRSETRSAPRAITWRPGWYAVSVNYLRGYKRDPADPDLYQGFLGHTPVARAGYSMYIYHIRE